MDPYTMKYDGVDVDALLDHIGVDSSAPKLTFSLDADGNPTVTYEDGGDADA